MEISKVLDLPFNERLVPAIGDKMTTPATKKEAKHQLDLDYIGAIWEVLPTPL